MSTTHAHPARLIPLTSLTTRLQVWSVAISNGLLSLFPLTFIGAVLLAILQAPWLETALQGPAQEVLERLLHATTGFMGLACAMMMAARLAEQDERALETAAPPAIAAVAAALFILGTTLDSPSPSANTSGLGYSQLFRGIVTGIITAELMLCFSRLMPRLDIAKSLDTENNFSLYAAMRLTLTACATLLVFMLMMLAYEQVQPGLQVLLSTALDSLLTHPDMTPALRYSLFALINQALWTFGINGGQLLLAVSNQGSAFVAAPEQLYSSTHAAPMFINAFAHMGGAGATWGLIVAILAGIKDPVLRRMALLSIFPAIFNVNELLLFGIPIVFGRALLLPFLLTPALLIIVPTLLAENGLLPLNGQGVSWSTPALLSGYLITGGAAGVVLQLLGIIVSALVYFPFLKKLEAQRKAVLKSSMQEALVTLCEAQPVSPSSLRRRDNTGAVSRALLRDFLRDMQTQNVCLHYQPQHDGNGHVVGFE
ncbi:MAG: PTS transporter subunit EIIC, partial [Moraxellaceae bacterium]|nr:PTS transporter subunit EIIC [Moraxellaceae bacterium]